MNSSSETLHWGNPIYFRAYVHIGKFSKKKKKKTSVVSLINDYHAWFYACLIQYTGLYILEE